MKGNKKKSLIWLICLFCAVLVFSLFSSLVQDSFGKVNVTNYNNLTLSEVAYKIDENNKESGKDIAITFTKSDTARMTYKVLQPKTATSTNKAPAIVIMHGGLSNKDTTSPVFVELARRGFVVIAFDAMGHGKTDKEVDALSNKTMGMEPMVELAMSLPYVDENNIGVTGHSWGDEGSAAVVSRINLHTTNPKIRAFLCAQGSLAIYELEKGATDGMVFGLSVGKYDEMDTTYMNSFYLSTQKWAISWIKAIYPEFSATEVPMYTWFDKDGGHTLTEGQKYAGSEVRVMYNPENTHPAALFSTSAEAVNINFFYGAFGVPSGNSYIASGNQVWPIMVTFSLLGMLSWFAMIIPIVTLSTSYLPAFKSLNLEDRGITEDRSKLPSFKNLKESIPLLAMFAGLVTFTAVMLPKLTSDGAKYIPTSNFFPNAPHQANAFGYWSLMTTLVTVACLVVIYLLKKYVLYRKQKDVVVTNPFAVIKTKPLDVIKSLGLGLIIVTFLYAVIFMIDGIFKVDFRMATLEFTTFRMDKIFVALRYSLLFFPFYFINSLLVANSRFKDLPNWVSLLIVIIGNSLGIAIFAAIEYTSLITTGTLRTTSAASTCTLMWTFFCPMTIAPIISYYCYKKTGNIWLAAFINTFLFTMSLVGTGQYMSQSITMFGF